MSTIHRSGILQDSFSYVDESRWSKEREPIRKLLGERWKRRQGDGLCVLTEAGREEDFM